MFLFLLAYIQLFFWVGSILQIPGCIIELHNVILSVYAFEMFSPSYLSCMFNVDYL